MLNMVDFASDMFDLINSIVTSSMTEQEQIDAGETEDYLQ